ncbi:MAG: hypothetical protein EPN47_15110 [Acidobacteria bacterium]|nr:MAG: hypothetical protein EPN47_15110 [Acidobacteriota bacterium]
MKYRYQSEKFSTARRLLMLPHPRGETHSIVSAFHECSLGLQDVSEEDLDETAGEYVRRLRELMDTTGLEDPTGEGVWWVKARAMTESDEFEIARIIDELASWFGREFWSNR